MHLDSNFHGTADTITTSPGDGRRDGPAGGPAAGADRLRHLSGSAEPARVFSELAAVCVPALCDQMVIDIDETDKEENGIGQAGVRRYRIRQPGGLPWPEIDDPSPWWIRVRSSRPVGRSPGWSGRCPGADRSTPPGWCAGGHRGMSRPRPTPLVGVLADHAVALVHRERSTGRIVDTTATNQVGALGRTQRVAAATGILMALHHLTAAQARQLLARAGDRTQQTLVQVADTVLHTGGLLDQNTTHPRETPIPAAPNPGATRTNAT